MSTNTKITKNHGKTAFEMCLDADVLAGAAGLNAPVDNEKMHDIDSISIIAEKFRIFAF